MEETSQCLTAVAPVQPHKVAGVLPHLAQQQTPSARHPMTAIRSRPRRVPRCGVGATLKLVRWGQPCEASCLEFHSLGFWKQSQQLSFQFVSVAQTLGCSACDLDCAHNHRPGKRSLREQNILRLISSSSAGWQQAPLYGGHMLLKQSGATWFSSALFPGTGRRLGTNRQPHRK